MVDSSSEGLLSELTEKQRRMRYWPWVTVLGMLFFSYLVLIGASSLVLWFLGITLLLAVVGAFYLDLLQKSVVLMYDLDEASEAAFHNVFEAVDELARCGAAWHISARGDVYDSKYHAGASNLVQRKSISIGQREPPYVRTNLSIPRIPLGDRTLYFLPDRLLLYASGGIGSLDYSDVRVEREATNFIESGTVPRDAKVVDHTWKYVNKSGGPDRRFKDNHEIPVCEYLQIHLSSGSGLNEQLQISNASAGTSLQTTLDRMASVLHSSRSAAQSSDVAPPNLLQPQPHPEIPIVAEPSTRQLFGFLLNILCCVMVADGRASKIEKTRIKSLMKKLRAPWTSDEVDERIASFIGEVQSKGFPKVLNESLRSVKWFRSQDRQEVLLKSIRAVALADGKASSKESVLCARIEGMLSSDSDGT